MSDKSGGKVPSSRERVVVGLLAVGAGVMPVLAGLDVPPFGGGKAPGAPGWLGIVAGATFIAGGLAVMAQDRVAGLSELLGLAAVAGLAAIANWIGFGAGTRNCTASVTGFFWREAGNLECRMAFGWGGLMADAMLILGVAALLKRRFGPRPSIDRLSKLGEWLLLGLCLPLILLLLVIVVFKGGGEALREWLGKRFGRGGK